MLRYIARLITDAGVIEVRHLPVGRSGTFDDAARLMSAIAPFMNAGDLYCTLNQPQRAALNSFGDRAFCDADMVRIKRIPFDLDPIRDRGRASTEQEVAAARHAAIQLARALLDCGFSKPLFARSGNGYHLQYRVDLPASQETKQMLAALYCGLAESCSTPAVVFDRTVRNPARILRLYGTVNRKGGAPRPTRYWMPNSWRTVEMRAIAKLANQFSSRPQPVQTIPRTIVTGPGDYGTLDVAARFRAHGLYEARIDAMKHAVVCPWEDEHSSSSRNDTIVLEADGGWPNFRCHHDHCVGRQIRDVMARLGDADLYCARRFK